jgi:hypothetical protein
MISCVATCRRSSTSVYAAVRGRVLGAVVVKALGTLFAWTVAFKTGVALSSYANYIAFFDVTFGFGTDAGCYTDYLMSNNDGIRSGSLHY